jgi:hypothetical protein
VVQKSDRFIDGADSFARAQPQVPGPDAQVAPKLGSPLLEKSRVDFRMLPRQIHFAHDCCANGSRPWCLVIAGEGSAAAKTSGENGEGGGRSHRLFRSRRDASDWLRR